MAFIRVKYNEKWGEREEIKRSIQETGSPSVNKALFRPNQALQGHFCAFNLWQRLAKE